MGVTIKDIARKTGLSITTISLVLNKKENRIPEKTRQIIESAAQELHYSPNQAAISLSTKKTNTIGLIIPKGSFYYFADLVSSIENACRSAGYCLAVAFPEGDGDSCLEAVHEMLRRGSDGIIFDSSIFSEAFYRDYTDLVLSADTPISSLAGAGAHLLPNSIVPDNRRGGYIAAFHLLELGHRRIGFIGGPRESYTAGDLFIGIEEALEEAKDQGSAAIPVFDGGNNTAAGHDALESLLGQGVTGIIAGSGIIASGVLRRAFELGIRIPEQLSLVAYGNCSLSQDLHVPLTVVSIHYDRIARKAVKLIKKLGEKSPPLTPELLLPSLIIRESTGKAPAAAQQA